MKNGTPVHVEEINLPAIHAIQTVLSLYASGLISSEDVSQSVPVNEGNALPKARVRLNLAGYEFTDYSCRFHRKGLLLHHHC